MEMNYEVYTRDGSRFDVTAHSIQQAKNKVERITLGRCEIEFVRRVG